MLVADTKVKFLEVASVATVLPQWNVIGISFCTYQHGFRLTDCIFTIFFNAKEEESVVPDDIDPNAGRFVRYQFTPAFLKLTTVGAT